MRTYKFLKRQFISPALFPTCFIYSSCSSDFLSPFEPWNLRLNSNNITSGSKVLVVAIIVYLSIFIIIVDSSLFWILSSKFQLQHESLRGKLHSHTGQTCARLVKELKYRTPYSCIQIRLQNTIWSEQLTFFFGFRIFNIPLSKSDFVKARRVTISFQ